MILLIDNYDSFTYNLYQYFEELGARTRVVRNDQITIDEIIALKPKAVVISPGPGNPDEAGISLEVIERLGERFPILGVCLGHQAIGQAFGGKVVLAPRQMHGKLSPVKHRKKGIFKGMPNPFTATRYHSLCIDKKSLPRCLEITAESDDGVIMGVRHRQLPIEGVQFHPESIMTEEGKRLLENFLALKPRKAKR